MAAGEERIIGGADLNRAVSAVVERFDAGQVIVIGSQALLVGREDIERSLRNG